MRGFRFKEKREEEREEGGEEVIEDRESSYVGDTEGAYGHTTGKAPVPVPLTEVKPSQAL